MSTLLTLSGTPNTAVNGTWTLTVTVTGTDGPYDGFVIVKDNVVDNTTGIGGTPVSGGVASVDVGGFNSGDHILYAEYHNSGGILVPSTSNVIAYTVAGFGSDDARLYPTDVQKLGGETLTVTWVPPELHDSGSIDNVYVLYWDSAWITDNTFPTKAHVSTLARDSNLDSYTWPAYDHTHIYNAMVIPHKQIIIDFGFGEAIVEHYYPVTATVAPISGNQDPPPFWPAFSLGHQKGDFSLKFDPATS